MIISDGAKLYPTLANSLGVPHLHVNHGKGVWVRRILRGPRPSVAAHTGTVDCFWKQLKGGMPKGISVTLNAKTQEINPQVMEYVHQFNMRWHNQDCPPQQLMKLVGRYVSANLIEYV